VTVLWVIVWPLNTIMFPTAASGAITGFMNTFAQLAGAAAPVRLFKDPTGAVPSVILNIKWSRFLNVRWRGHVDLWFRKRWPAARDDAQTDRGGNCPGSRHGTPPLVFRLVRKVRPRRCRHARERGHPRRRDSHISNSRRPAGCNAAWHCTLQLADMHVLLHADLPLLLRH
jgi:hypothetical protein